MLNSKLFNSIKPALHVMLGVAVLCIANIPNNLALSDSGLNLVLEWGFMLGAAAFGTWALGEFVEGLQRMLDKDVKREAADVYATIYGGLAGVLLSYFAQDFVANYQFIWWLYIGLCAIYLIYLFKLYNRF